MTGEEVITIMGRPRAISTLGTQTNYNYGEYWIVLESGVVKCIKKSENFSYRGHGCDSDDMYPKP
jgi:Cu2+-containing amine oxidase